jgi:hypothetical protein
MCVSERINMTPQERNKLLFTESDLLEEQKANSTLVLEFDVKSDALA